MDGRNARRLSILLLLGSLSVSAFGASTEHSPAGFGSGERTLDQLIKFPDAAASSTMDRMLTCQGIVKANGKMAQGACFVKEFTDAPYAEAVKKAAKKARFKPATYNGRKIGVYFQYRIRFSRTEEENHITLYANQAYPENLDAYGEDHIAAQRGVMREKWQKSCPSLAHFVAVVRAHVAADGTQSSIKVTHGNGIPISAKCSKAIAETIEQSVFIPAYADGEAVPSSYLEAFGN